MRKLKSWIASFEEYMQAGSTPEIFRRWSGISTIAGALEQKTWVTTMGENLFPNLYVIIVAPAGVGKTFVTKSVWRLWSTLEGHHLASSSLTSASLADELRHAQRNITLPQSPPIQFHSLKICANEMQVLIPAYDFDFMGKLTDIYDGHPYSERRRKEDNSFFVKHPQINMLAATTPKYLNSVIPEAAWDQGFMSRCILVFHGEQERRSLFAAKKGDEKLWKDLAADLASIGNLYGQMIFTDDAADSVDAWYLEGCPPAPDHPRLSSYQTRRHANILKLMQVSCADRGDDRVIEKIDFERALTWLFEAEMAMPEIFKAMSASGDGRILEDCHHAMWSVFLKTGSTPIPKKMVYLFLQKRLPAYAVEGAIKSMEASGMMKAKTVPPYGTCYVPLRDGPGI